jgi:copper(I)-binding protein
MHRVARAAVVGLVGMVGLTGSAPSARATQKEPSALSGWVRLPAAGATTTTGFIAVENPTMYAIYLLSATADVAGKVEIREIGKDGAAKPDAVTEVTVPAYGTIEMNPKGLHLVLSDLKRPLKEGDTVWLSVTTDLGMNLQIAAPVKKE